MKNLIKKYGSVSSLFLAPLIAFLLIKHIAGDHFLEYSLSGDAPWELSYLKLYYQNIFNHIYKDPLMGAPLIIDNHYWPWRQLVLGSYYFIIGLFEKDIIQIYDIFYRSLFPICALTMFLSLRYLVKLPNVISLGISLLYAFIPYMFGDKVIQQGTVLINSVFIPLLLGIIFYLNFKSYKSYPFTRHLKSKSTILISLIILIGASSGFYNCFYFFLLLFFLLGKELISQDGDKRKIQIILFFLLINFLVGLFNVYPHLALKADSHFTFHHIERNFVHTTFYGLTIVEFFIPIKNHIFETFQFFNDLYRQNTLIKSDFDHSYLGILGIVSFCTSLMYAFKKHKPEDDFSKKLGFLGITLIFLLLLCSRGGLITVFYLYTDFLVLGSQHRVTPWITCISLIGAGIILNRIYKKIILEKNLINNSKNTIPNIYLKGVLTFFFFVIIAFSLLDFRGNQPRFTKEGISATNEYKTEKAFYSQLTKEIDDKDMILQIPYVCWIETKDILGTSYMNTWSYVLIEKETRFSWMAFKEGTACNINSQISSMSNKVEEMLKYAFYYGYTGIILDTKGYKDKGADIVNQMKDKFGLTPKINTEYIYYDIDVKELREEINPGDIHILPEEGDSLDRISWTFSYPHINTELERLEYLFPSPCRIEQKKGRHLDIISRPRPPAPSWYTFGGYPGRWEIKNQDREGNVLCRGKLLQNKDFFYFADDKINLNSNLDFENRQISVEKNYIGNILSVSITTTLDEGIYKIILNNNDMTSLSNESLTFQVTLWGMSFPLDDTFTFKLENKLHGKKLKPIHIYLYKRNVTDKDLQIRSVTIRKIQSLPSQSTQHIKKISRQQKKLSLTFSHLSSALESIKETIQ